MSTIEAVAVVVPARDEEALLPDCLESVRVAAGAVDVPVVTVVALDSCVDDTAAVVARAGAIGVPLRSGRVGAARAAGTRAALDALAGVAPQRVWVASTDADSRVPAGWLRHHLALAAAGADLVLGVVEPPDDGGLLDVVRTWRRAYARLVRPDGHEHVHAANLGVRASAYLAAGGWADVAAHEDRLLAQAVAALPGRRVVTTVGAPVATSARVLARAPHGLAADLRALAAERPLGA
ncbi:glycosyl transferase [Angustibacter aerolatus]|uniref:4,4'-diaponeurosporenoate glycosyltransferase n=1 Tax=Angustibacter aerolatus TaxID=1162965 RepID=A0ABQ6JHI8_9ACTN|nr:glycosyl transferase [Angustibacter aerolatus]